MKAETDVSNMLYPVAGTRLITSESNQVKNQLTCFYGTRPEYLKILPVVEELRKRGKEVKLVRVNQHTDLLKDAECNKEVLLPESFPNRLDSLVADTLPRIRDLIKTSESVLVQGDTTTAMTVALSAFLHQKRIIHLEAGLRSYCNQHPYPEEANRRIISSVANIHLCPTDENKLNLEKEFIAGNKHVTGNTGLDSIMTAEYTPLAPKDSHMILVTMHRRENLELMDRWFEEIEKLAEIHPELHFVFPLHPNPEIQKHKDKFFNVHMIPAVNHNTLLNYLAKSKVVITDSGGVFEECTFLKRPVVVCRKVTERPEGFGHDTALLAVSPMTLSVNFERMLEVGNKADLDYYPNCPFGDGQSAKRVVDVLINEGVV